MSPSSPLSFAMPSSFSVSLSSSLYCFSSPWKPHFLFGQLPWPLQRSVMMSRPTSLAPSQTADAKSETTPQRFIFFPSAPFDSNFFTNHYSQSSTCNPISGIPQFPWILSIFF
ncbi:hypothetical protein AAZX31_06G202400 [Glycine max]